jgi:hypothetical protein
VFSGQRIMARVALALLLLGICVRVAACIASGDCAADGPDCRHDYACYSLLPGPGTSEGWALEPSGRIAWQALRIFTSERRILQLVGKPRQFPAGSTADPSAISRHWRIRDRLTWSFGVGFGLRMSAAASSSNRGSNSNSAEACSNATEALRDRSRAVDSVGVRENEPHSYLAAQPMTAGHEIVRNAKAISATRNELHFCPFPKPSIPSRAGQLSFGHFF